MAHIAMLIPSLVGGGAERSVLTTAAGLAAHGHRIDIVLFSPVVVFRGEMSTSTRLVVLCGRREWRRRSKADMPEGTVWRSELAGTLSLTRLLSGLVREFRSQIPTLLSCTALGRARRFARYMERERPQIVFVNHPSAENPAFFGARLVADPPFIIPIMRGVLEPGTKRTRRRRLLFPAAARIVAVSRGVAQNAATVLNLPEDTITTVYNPAFTPDIAARAEAVPSHPWLRDDGPPIILGAGRLEGQKDFLTLIEAFHRLLRDHPCRLVILGEGRMRLELEERVRALDLEDYVSLPGWTENPFAFMARSSLFVLSSRFEGLPGVLIQALACGCPAVSTDCPAGPSEILENSELLAPVGDPNALARAMLLALNCPADKAALRENAARFSVERTVDGYEKIIHGLLYSERLARRR